jgi:hypothetical protein
MIPVRRRAITAAQLHAAGRNERTKQLYKIELSP